MAQRGSQWDLSRLSDGEWCTPAGSYEGPRDDDDDDFEVNYDTDGDCGPDRDRHQGYFLCGGEIYFLEEGDSDESSDEDPPSSDEEVEDDDPPSSEEEVEEGWWCQPHAFDMNAWLLDPPFSDGLAVPDEYECPICIQGADGEEEKGQLVALNCTCRGQAYHMACISRWKDQQIRNGLPPTCPLCKSRIH